jgi:hypothetical protein
MVRRDEVLRAHDSSRDRIRRAVLRLYRGDASRLFRNG